MPSIKNLHLILTETHKFSSVLVALTSKGETPLLRVELFGKDFGS